MVFSGKKTKAGWISLALHDDGIAAASVHLGPNGTPVVDLLTFYASGNSAASPLLELEKLARELRAGQYQCSNLLGMGEYQLLLVDAPNVPADELKTAMRWRLKDMLDYHVDDATFDVLTVPADKDAAVRNQAMYVAAARNQLIEQRQSLFEKAKLPLHAIDVPEMAQRNIATLLEQEGRGLALLSFGAQGGLLTLSVAGELYLARRIEVTLEQLNAANEGPERGALYDRVTLELQRSLDHFDRQYRHAALSRLVIAPIGAAAPALQSHLAENLYLPVEVLDLADIFDISKAPQLQQTAMQQRHFFVLGAALRREKVTL